MTHTGTFTFMNKATGIALFRFVPVGVNLNELLPLVGAAASSKIASTGQTGSQGLPKLKCFYYAFLKQEASPRRESLTVFSLLLAGACISPDLAQNVQLKVRPDINSPGLARVIF
jgi:hypothetical protein